MRQVRAGFFKQLLDVLHRLFGLCARVTQAYQLAFEVGTDLATHVDGIACPHGLAQVVVQGLVGVGFLGVEHADASMGRHQWAPRVLTLLILACCCSSAARWSRSR
ncbi:hypothetical protein D9M71_779990 [compost metagenome]